MEKNDGKQEAKDPVRELESGFKSLQEKVTQLSSEVKTLRSRGAPPGGSVEPADDASATGAGYFNSRLMVTSLHRPGPSSYPPDSYRKDAPDESEPKDVKTIEYNKGVDKKRVYSLYRFRSGDAEAGTPDMSVLARDKDKTTLLYLGAVYEGF